MARVKTLDTATVTKEAKTIFSEIEGAFGMVPNLFRTYAH